MKEKLNSKLKSEGRSLRWFHQNYAPPDMTYNALALQLNGYAVICDQVKKAVYEYLQVDE